MPKAQAQLEAFLPGIFIGADGTALIADSTADQKVRFRAIAQADITGLVAALAAKVDATPGGVGGAIAIGTIAGTDTYTSAYALTALAANQLFYGTFTNANTGAATLNINSLGAKAIQYKGSALSAARIPAGSNALLMYDGTQFQLCGYWG